MKPQLTVGKAPCGSCPYRKDVPSGVWHAHEYHKLLIYDTPMVVQLTGGGLARFDCHQQDGKLCAGWVGCHGADNLISLRMLAFEGRIADEVWGYKSPVPLFASGAEASAHGLRDIRRPKKAAKRMVGKLMRRLGSKLESK